MLWTSRALIAQRQFPPAVTQDTFSGTSGDDFFVGTFGLVFAMQDGGNDQVSGSFGNDIFGFGSCSDSRRFHRWWAGHYDILT